MIPREKENRTRSLTGRYEEGESESRMKWRSRESHTPVSEISAAHTRTHREYRKARCDDREIWEDIKDLISPENQPFISPCIFHFFVIMPEL